jgi:hypothetical protein
VFGDVDAVEPGSVEAEDLAASGLTEPVWTKFAI